jgi:peptidoglycan/LPS O-acetylase OafA/YrhL
MTPIFFVWEALCVALLWSVFCRLVRTNDKTLWWVRASIWLLGVAALVGMAAPVYGWKPDAVVLLMTVACLNMQVVAARHWRNGVPSQFQYSQFPPLGGVGHD